MLINKFFLRKWVSKTIAETEQFLTRNLESIKNNELRVYVNKLNRMDPSRTINSVLQEVETETGLKLVILEANPESILLEASNICKFQKEGLAYKIVSVFKNYPFFQCKIEKNKIELKKLRITGELKNTCYEKSRVELEQFRKVLKMKRKEFDLKQISNEDLEKSYEIQLENGLKEIIKSAEAELLKHQQKLKKI